MQNAFFRRVGIQTVRRKNILGLSGRDECGFMFQQRLDHLIKAVFSIGEVGRDARHQITVLTICHPVQHLGPKQFGRPVIHFTELGADLGL